ncbi:MAG: ankyrin repeat domain-containing protein, partial [bacterium]
MRVRETMTLGMLVVLSLVTATAVAQEPNRFNDTPLHIAASTHNLALVQQLVDDGAVIDARNKNSLTPLWFAAQRSS